MEYILIFIAAVFVNNVVLAQFLGICPFLGVSKKVETAAGMGAVSTFFDTPRNGQIPRNCANTTLLTNTAAINISIYSISFVF